MPISTIAMFVIWSPLGKTGALTLGYNFLRTASLFAPQVLASQINEVQEISKTQCKPSVAFSMAVCDTVRSWVDPRSSRARVQLASKAMRIRPRRCQILIEECRFLRKSSGSLLWLGKGRALSFVIPYRRHSLEPPASPCPAFLRTQPPKPLSKMATQGLDARTRWTRFSAYFRLFHQHV